jgi:exodeoxyribonuclease V alpha subunit
MIVPNLGIFVIYPFEGYAVLYSELKYDVVNLAYSISIHKSQGQEYRKVYIPVLDEHLFMLNSRALYTAVTRAREKVFIYAQKYCFPKAVSKKDTEKRDTLLYRILKGV